MKTKTIYWTGAVAAVMVVITGGIHHYQTEVVPREEAKDDLLPALSELIAGCESGLSLSDFQELRRKLLAGLRQHEEVYGKEIRQSFSSLFSMIDDCETYWSSPGAGVALGAKKTEYRDAVRWDNGYRIAEQYDIPVKESMYSFYVDENQSVRTILRHIQVQAEVLSQMLKHNVTE